VNSIFRLIPITVLSFITAISVASRAYGDNGITDKKIKLGSSAALSGPNAKTGLAMQAGNELYWKRVNAAGGVGGRTIETVYKDDAFDPQKAVKAMGELIEKEKVFAVISPLGTHTTQAVMPMVKKSGIPHFGAIVGTEAFTVPPIENLFLVRGSFYAEAEQMAAVAVDHYNEKSIGILRDSTGLGNSAKSALDRAINKRGFKIAVDAVIPPNVTDIEKAVETMMATKPKIVVLWAIPAQSAPFIKLAKAKGWTPTYILSSAAVSNDTLKELDDAGVKSTFITFKVPHYSDHKFEIAKQYTRDTKAAGIEPSNFAFETYVNAAVFHEALKKAGANPNRKSLFDAITEMKDVNIGGLKIGFSDTNHVGLNQVFLVKYEGGEMH
jgi:branched-chain amino acid transport system substrate-binding protein